jgi:hypothetical protein
MDGSEVYDVFMGNEEKTQYYRKTSSRNSRWRYLTKIKKWK